MNRAFTQTLMRPNLPLRRPATGPSSLTPRGPAPTFHELALENLLASDMLDGPVGDAVRKENVFSAKNSQNCGDFLSPSQTAGSMVGPLVKLCNYCSHQGNFRCNRCKKTCYCSVACQTQDWKAHRHVCKPSIPEVASDKTKESTAMPSGNGLGGLQAKPNRMYRRDLRKNVVSKGSEIQGTVIDLRNPGEFSIHLQSVEMMESLKNITTELQKAYSTSFAAEYKPEIGELCAVKFSLDRNWYRAEVRSVDVTRRVVSVFYIDFGNEENVTLDNIRPLSENIDAAPPFALQCCVAGVKPLTGSWTGECTIAVRQLIAGKSLTFTVLDIMNDGALLAVDVPLSTLGKYMSTFLIEQGYAVKEDVPVKPQTEHDINSLMTASFENFKRLSGGKNENSEARPPEPLSQGVGDTFTAIVTHLQSPSEILCQKLENANIIQQLQASLREHCSKTPASENFRPAPGTVCCSLFSEDNQWYRAKVLAYSSEDCVCVGYIDFGNSEEVELYRLRPISKELLALATQSIPCSLAGIKCPAGTWPEEAILMVKRLVCNRFIRVEILGKKDGRALVSMIDESSDPQTNAAEVLVNMGYAAIESVETEKNEPTQASFPEMPSLSPPVVEKMEWTCAELPFDGQKVELIISSLKSLDEFYCYNYSKADAHILTELSYELMKHCELERASFTPTVGEPCCALFTGDARWYRAMVLEVFGEGKAKVYFVDYGNSCEVEAAHLKAITPSLLKLPFQAIRCWLAGVEPVEGQWNKEAIHKFQALCAGQPLSGRVLSISEKGYGVELESAGQSIAAMLISEHLAKPYGQVKQPPVQQAKPTSQIEDLPTLKPIDQSPPAEEPLKVNKGAAKDTEGSTSSIGSFPLNWKTLELSCTDTFQPRVAAVISPSLFYIMNPGQGKENFPTVWPSEVLELFANQLSGGILASLQGFDGTSNLLTLTQQSGQTNRDINSIILGALQKGQSKANSKPPVTAVEEKKDVHQRQTPTVSSVKATDQPQSAHVEKPDLEDQAPPLSASYRLEEPVWSISSVQEMQTDLETIMKINAAGEMMQCSTAMDILFVMDSSYSVGKGGFERSLHYVLKLCEALDVSTDKVRVGVILFGSTPKLEISLDSYKSKEELKKKMKKIHYRGGSTQTGLALKFVLRKGFSGGRNSTVPRVVILLSDGKSQGAVQLAASELKLSGVTLFAVGVRYPRWEELRKLASSPSDSYVFFAEHFSDAVNGLFTTLTTSSVCTAVPSGCKVESYPCVQKTLETVKELQGNFMCWKGSKGYLPYTSLCPHYRYNKVYRQHPVVCHRTICPAPILSFDCSVDVLFLLEGSSALTLEGFLHFKSFLKRFMQAVLSSDTPVKMGLAQYGSDVKIEAKIGEHRDPVKLIQAVEGLGYRGGQAKAGNALHYVTRHGFQSTPVFADIQDDLPRVVVLLTGTPSVDPVIEPAKYARDREIFIIGVAPEEMRAEINNITGNPQRTIKYQSPDRLSAKIPELRAKICSVDNQGCLGQALDLVFVLDASSGVGKDNFVHLQDFVRSTSVQFDINRDVAQMGLVVYGRRPVTVFDLDKYDSGSAVLKAVGDAAFLGEKASTGSALLHVLSQSLTVGKGARPGVNKAVVVLTDGTGLEDAAVPAQKIRDSGVSVFVIGIGDIHQEVLFRIAGSEDHMISVPSYDDLKYSEDVLEAERSHPEEIFLNLQV
ncbi:hypothetical protein cypCar_00018882 [Cyprinus carpio]|nr:hypothetical protein cypCar_00018882 [Cyprinus carpio]